MFAALLPQSAGRAWRLALLLAALSAGTAAAQTGSIAGTVRDSAGAPVAGAEVTLAGQSRRDLTDADGRFRLAEVAAGAHTLVVRRLGFRRLSHGVAVRAGAESRADLVLASLPTLLSEIVTSASRTPQRLTEAPATISRIDADVIQNSVGNSFSGALREVKGIDYIQVGVTAAAINARGFNSSFNNRMLMMEDGRIAVLPENGLPVGIFTTIPRIDLAGVEVLVGPGAALYGADASNGVLTLQTRDPRADPGTAVEFTGGSRSYADVQLRHAATSGNWAYKVTGEYLSADEYSNQLSYRFGTTFIPEIGIDFHTTVARANGMLGYYVGDRRLEFSTGWSQSNGVGQTNVGRNQLSDWGYNFQQVRLVSPSWYLNLYRTQSTAGDTYATNRFTVNRAANPALSEDSVRALSDWPSNGQLYAAEVQHNFRVPSLLGTRVIWGAQYRHDRVSSDGQWLTDRFTGGPIGIDQFGLYAQTETDLHERLRLVLAARYDNHERYDAQFSPKVGVIVQAHRNHSFRATYNRAYKSPTTLQTDFYIPDFVPTVGVFGNADGFTVRDAAGTVLSTVAPLEPEENQTWELGWRGLLWDRLSLDLAAYRASYENFIGSLQPINVVALGTFAHDATGQRITSPIGPQTVLTYRNLGDATIRGVDLGARLSVSPRVTLSGVFSWLDLGDVTTSPTDPQATALNSPGTKLTLGATVEEIVPNLSGSLTARGIDGYDFASGINVGYIPGFATVDASFGYRLPRWNMRLQLTVTNLFTCQASATGGSTACGFGQKHVEMINMPELGTAVFVGVRYTR